MNSNNAYTLVFAGTPEFSVATLDALARSRHEIKAVYTQPDRPAGRGRKITASPVKEAALQHGLPVCQPTTLRDETEQQKLADWKADLLVVVAYGMILPKAVLAIPARGCINIHPSLLPRWRGAAPIQRAIFAGDTLTGITIMQMDEGLDTGPTLHQVTCPITPTDTSASLHDQLAALGADALLATLDNLSRITPRSQDSAQATYAEKISKEEARLDWTLPAYELNWKIRAFNPWPVADTLCDEKTVRIWQADIIPQTSANAAPGTILNVSTAGIDVMTGKDILRLQKIQLPGGRILTAAEIPNATINYFITGKKLG